MISESSTDESTLKILLKSTGVGFLLFWLVGVWFLPEKAFILDNFRGFISLGVVMALLGRYIYSSSRYVTKKIGVIVMSISLAYAGAFFAMCFYLAISPMFK